MLKKLLKILKKKLRYSRENREELQRDLYRCLLEDKPFNDILYKVIHIGAYYDLHDVKKYHTKENIPFAIKYSELVKKYVPNIDLEYPNNVNFIYEQFKKDILSSCLSE